MNVKQGVVVTVEYVREMLSYDPLTGVFLWAKSPHPKILVGTVAGSIPKNGHRTIRMKRGGYLASRLAWLYMTGEWPKEIVDHRDRVRHNDSWVNLFDTNSSINRHNSTIGVNNTSGVKGVFLDKRTNKWYVQIAVNKKRIHVCYCATFEEAVVARLAAEQKYYPALHMG